MFIYDDQGKKVVRYDKVHLFKYSNQLESYDETLHCEAGNKAVSVETPAGNTFLSICYDLRFPEFFRRIDISDKPIDLILLSAAFTTTTGKAHWEILLRARAIENQCFVLASAQGGNHESGRSTWGHSMFVSPWGDIIEKCEFGNSIIYGTVDNIYMNKIRKNLPAIQHQRLNIRKDWNVRK
jgi:nitrilase